MGRCGVAKGAYTVLSVASVVGFHRVQRIFLRVGHFGYNGSEYSGANFVRDKKTLEERKKWKFSCVQSYEAKACEDLVPENVKLWL